MLKNLLGRLPLFFLLLILLSRCGSDRSGTGEPNDSILDAGALESEKAISMRIDSSGDRDWFALPLKGDGYVEAGIKRTPDKLRLEVRFAEKTPWQKQKMKWLTKWDSMPVTTPLFRDRDTVFFAIQDARGRSSKKEFRFRARFIEELDEHEPNDKPEEAKQIELEEELRSVIYPEKDRDYFKIDMERKGYIRARTQAIPEGLGAEVRFLRKRADGRPLPISGYRSFPAAVAINEEGSYYLELGDDHDDAQSRTPLKWHLEFIPQMDSTEPNARWKNATKVLVGQTVELALFPKGDRDHFRLRPSRSVDLRIEGEDLPEIVPQLQLVRDGEKGHETLSEWRNLPGTFSLEGGEEYFLILRSKEDKGSDSSPFTLHFKEEKKS